MQLEDENITKQVDAGQAVIAKGAMKRAGAFFFLLMILEIPVALLIRHVQGKFPADCAVLISVLMTQGYLLLGGIFYLLITRQSLRKDLRLKSFRISDFFLSLLLLVLSAPMASLLNVLSQFFAENETSGAIFSVTEKMPMLLGIAVIGCLPGFIEEMLYRGIMLHAFRKRSIWTGVVVSGLSFGLMHMNFNQILYAVYLGILFALVVEVTDSLLSTMILHMIFNGVNTAQLYLLPKLYEMAARFDSSYANFDMEAAVNATVSKELLVSMTIVLFPLAVGGMILGLLLLRAMANRNGKEFTWQWLSGCSEEMKRRKPVTVCLVLGWLFCIASAVSALLV